jgi:hypothetical protein
MKGNRAELWQHPYVSVFKHVDLEHWVNAKKEGDVTEVYERSCGRKVFKLKG